MEKLRAELQRRAAPVPESELLLQMGYPKPRETAIHRLQKVLADPDLGLTSGGFDFRFGSRAFLCALCEALGLDEADYLPTIDARQQWLREERNAFKPYIFIDTGFKRSDRPGTAIFALAVCEPMRHLKFPKGFWRRPWHEQIEEARRRVRQFMAETDGDVRIWGTAKRFLFFHARDAAIEIDPFGQVLGGWQGGVPSRASLRVGHKEITAQPAADDQ
ncbi:hypothetical protein FGL86_00960 [Pistricoccus aurantiacus]|uniref:Uncharacterized protein n=1 Tax=Pistricoccus aurantiacus TaxID=1883414 RepID=A0A5B8SQU4_9GAMM|nr:hypothetical protein [Pistricoccus aurantiacus]QEA37775.1 hypothetical protein FGL86_00960 [Pistricoccus aurantiacus]